MSQHHDPVHPDSDHLSAETLADLDLGLLDAASTEHASHHLEQCVQCQALHADLASLSEALQRLSEQPAEPMPEAVWEELAEAIAAEPVLTPEGAATVLPIDAPDRGQRAGERKRRLGRPGIGVVAAAAGIALVSAIAVPTLLNGGVNSASDSSGGPAAASGGEQAPSAADFTATKTGTRYEPDDLGQQVNSLVAARGVMVEGLVGSADESEAEGDSSTTLDTSPQPSSSASPAPTSTPEASKLTKRAASSALATSPAAAQECLEQYLDASGVTPLAIDIGTWEGKPAAVIVLPLQDPTVVEVWVIKPSCSTSSTQDPLYYFATIER
ncbi:MAG TPA: hypothetical protein VFX15_06965 [Actinomycetes bacterium]|nr:hypothetical protein [Actinomycetes bacterium]